MISYNIDEKNKVIIAKLTGCEHDVNREFVKRFMKNDSLSTVEVYTTGEANLRFEYVGKCRFEKDEPFDVELGKKIAKERCLKKYHTAKDKMYEKIMSDLLDIRVEIFSILNKPHKKKG
jgi:hypothetical protein